MDFPKMDHFPIFLDWGTLIYGDNGIFINWMVLFKWSISYLLPWILSEGEQLANERPGMVCADQSEACSGSSRWSRSSITLRSSPCSQEWARDEGFLVTNHKKIFVKRKENKKEGENVKLC